MEITASNEREVNYITYCYLTFDWLLKAWEHNVQVGTFSTATIYVIEEKQLKLKFKV